MPPRTSRAPVLEAARKTRLCEPPVPEIADDASLPAPVPGETDECSPTRGVQVP